MISLSTTKLIQTVLLVVLATARTVVTTPVQTQRFVIQQPATTLETPSTQTTQATQVALGTADPPSGHASAAEIQELLKLVSEHRKTLNLPAVTCTNSLLTKAAQIVAECNMGIRKIAHQCGGTDLKVCWQAFRIS